jgi:hypothetical protein
MYFCCDALADAASLKRQQGLEPVSSDFAFPDVEDGLQPCIAFELESAADDRTSSLADAGLK